MDEQGMEEGDRSKKNIEPAFAKAMAGRAPNQPSLKLRRARRSTSNVERAHGHNSCVFCEFLLLKKGVLRVGGNFATYCFLFEVNSLIAFLSWIKSAIFFFFPE